MDLRERAAPGDDRVQWRRRASRHSPAARRRCTPHRSSTNADPTAQRADFENGDRRPPKADTSKKSDDGPKVEGPKADNSKPGRRGSLTAKELAAIKQLPEAEQAVALKQLVCPVSGEPLGEMGKPLKVTYEGRSFYLCCKAAKPKSKPIPRPLSPSSTRSTTRTCTTRVGPLVASFGPDRTAERTRVAEEEHRRRRLLHCDHVPLFVYWILN